MSSLDSDVRADNRTFDYNDSYTREDITTDIIDVINYVNRLYYWRAATITSNEEYAFADLFFEIYDINSVLMMSGEIKNKDQLEVTFYYPLRDKNWDELNDTLTHTFTADDIHDPADSTSLLKTTLPDLDHTDGDLLLSTADTKTDTYSPVLKNYPIFWFLRDISDLADSVTIVKASGVVLLDDDLASGDSLDVDTAADKNKMTAAPIVNDILETINYFEILGAINPDTGERFYKVTDNSGTDKKRKWRYVNNELRNQTDVDAYAAKLVARFVPVRIITISVQDMGVHDMGTTLNYKYIKGAISITQANYYIIDELINFDRNLAYITLSEGLIEESKYSATFERPENYVNSFASEIYETDINTVFPELFALSGSGSTKVNDYIVMNAAAESGGFTFDLTPYIDDSRDIIIMFSFKRVTADAGTVGGLFNIGYASLDGGTIAGIAVDVVLDCPGGDANQYETASYTLDSADVHANSHYLGWWTLNEAAREVHLVRVSLIYYTKRSV